MRVFGHEQQVQAENDSQVEHDSSTPSEGGDDGAEGVSPAGTDVFIEEGMFSIGLPGEDYQWEQFSETEIEGVLTRHFVCSRDGSNSRIVLMVQDVSFDNEDGRIAALKGHWNGLVQMISSAGAGLQNQQRPSLEPPVPERNEYSLEFRNADGDEFRLHGLTVFGEHTCVVFSVSGFDEAEQFLATIRTLELPED